MPFIAGSTTWTPEQIAILTQMWESGATANAIARVLSMTKNQIIGKAHRLHLASRPSPIIRTPGAVRKPKQPAVKTEGKWSLSTTVIPIAYVRAIPTATPTRRSEPCAWPEGEGRDIWFCNADSLPGRPYCSCHTSRSLLRRAA